MNKIYFRGFAAIIILILNLPLINMYPQAEQEHPTLAPGQAAPDFNLPGTDGKNYSLNDFKKDKILVIIFTCNHCPTAQSYEDRIKQLVNDYSGKGVGFVAISPNDPQAVRPDELGYTDLGDDFEDMKIRAAYKKFNFPYLYDGATQETTKKYGPVATPHVFIFDQERKLRYVGRIDDSEEGVNPATKHDTRNALDEMLAGKEVTVAQTKTFGCSIKWAEKRDWAKRFYEDLYKEEVSLDTIGIIRIERLIRNDSDKLRLINVWATWCGPCVAEFPDIMKINQMYRHRDFELITISADNPAKKDNVLEFLKKNHASNRNYIYNSADQYALIEAVDKNWQGGIPYTLLVNPGGEIIYAQQGMIDPLEMKRRIVGILGREKDW
jgi:thiol-disulfide isomerase/thioredoxin